MEKVRKGPQPGPQTMFLSTPADIAFYGGAAGGGKSYGLLLEQLRHYHNPDFGAVIFRRSTTQVRNEGALWDESMKLYLPMGGYAVESTLEWTFPSGSRLKFAHLEHERTVHDWQGSQIPYIGFDELTHFTEKQFTYMMSRNRSSSGVPGYIRGTCNADRDSWVRRWVDWYIGPNGYAIPERSGKLRWFIRLGDSMIWADSKEELVQRYGPETMPKSFTFISSKLTDNKILMEKDPSYLASLLALPRVDRERLLEANWNTRVAAGTIFRREWFQIINSVPEGWISACRFWDRAATKPNENNRDPDWTRGLKLLKYPNGIYVIADLKSTRDTPGGVEKLIKECAQFDGHAVPIRCQQDPGSAGVSESEHFIKMLDGYDVKTAPFFKDKVTRAKPVSSQVEFGFVRLVCSTWNEDLLSELESFPDGAHDDIVDTLSGAYNELCANPSILDVL